jgi:NosR/NirI family nitrous oxide reductase transcriptional regulator
MRPSRLANTRQLSPRRLLLLILILFLIPAIYFGQQRQTSAAESTATETATTPSIPSDLYRINQTEVIGLINNRTDVDFVRSTGNYTYYIIRSPADLKVLGLVYYSPDIAPDYTFGYASNVGMLVYIDTNGTIQAVDAYRIMWESYHDRITPDWLQTLVNRNVFEPLQIGQDIQGVTGATRTSTAIVDGVREAGRRVVDDYKMTPTQHKENAGTFQVLVYHVWTIVGPKSLAETLVIVGLYVSALIAYAWDDKRIRYAVMGAAIIFIGFYVGRMISIVDLTGLPMAGFPPILSNTYWYALFGLALITSIFLGRLYCGYLCPFGAFTQILHDISPFKIKIPLSLSRKLAFAKYGVLVGVVAGVVLGDFWVTGFEPFETFFFLTGQWWMWLVMGVAVLSSIPAERFFCRYLCPAGAVLSLLGGLRLNEIKRWPECDKCLVCQRSCPTGAIVGAKISALECMDCRECERNYLDARICPHYRLERTISQSYPNLNSAPPRD